MDVAAAPVSCRPSLKSLAAKHVKLKLKPRALPRALPRASLSTPLASLAVCGQRLHRRLRGASCAKAQTDAEAVKLWQEAFGLELERAERLGTSAEAPSDSAPASEWQAAYESLKAANLQLEMEAVQRRRQELKKDDDKPPAPKKARSMALVHLKSRRSRS